jgi:hypothetical protein
VDATFHFLVSEDSHAAAGRLTVPVSHSYPLAEVPVAFGDFAVTVA